MGGCGFGASLQPLNNACFNWPSGSTRDCRGSAPHCALCVMKDPCYPWEGGWRHIWLRKRPYLVAVEIPHNCKDTSMTLCSGDVDAADGRDCQSSAELVSLFRPWAGQVHMCCLIYLHSPLASLSPFVNKETGVQLRTQSHTVYDSQSLAKPWCQLWSQSEERPFCPVLLFLLLQGTDGPSAFWTAGGCPSHMETIEISHQ